MDFSSSMSVAASGLRAQSDRMKVIAENIANANSTSPNPGGDPYRRKIATETNSFDRELGANLVQSGKPIEDKSEFRTQYDPGNPNADKQGYIKLPNVDSPDRNHGHEGSAAFLRSRPHRDGRNQADAVPGRRPAE
jgi:flagellar basal-body rod protein FlgC